MGDYRTKELCMVNQLPVQSFLLCYAWLEALILKQNGVELDDGARYCH
jgi:hypothetical protein